MAGDDNGQALVKVNLTYCAATGEIGFQSTSGDMVVVLGILQAGIELFKESKRRAAAQAAVQLVPATAMPRKQ